MKVVVGVGTLVKRVYDLVASYLLFWVLAGAMLAWLLFIGSDQLATRFGFSDQDLMWAYLGRPIGLNGTQMRLVTFAPVHLVTAAVLWKPMGWARERIAGVIEQFTDGLQRATAGTPHCIIVAEAGFTLAITASLVPFVLQPTMVPLEMTKSAWAQRVTHLVDGSASAAFVESGIGLWKRLLAPDQESVRAGTSAQFAIGDGLMDRWDPVIWDAVDGDRHRFAQVKAVIWVESAGRQFAVSHTGCLGLMQFCVGTARREPFKAIFGSGTVYPCGCPDGGCTVSQSMKEALEVGDQATISANKRSFPCELSDSRFDPHKSIGSGSRYLSDLSADLGDNLLLMYVGYNSGPTIAKRVFADLQGNGEATVEDIALHLESELAPFYSTAERRAKGLTSTHLPKLDAAYDRFYAEAAAGPPAG